jgi:hypothetical protein
MSFCLSTNIHIINKVEFHIWKKGVNLRKNIEKFNCIHGIIKSTKGKKNHYTSKIPCEKLMSKISPKSLHLGFFSIWFVEVLLFYIIRKVIFIIDLLV